MIQYYTFTKELPTPAPYGVEVHYIAVNRKDWMIRAPLSDVQLSARFGPHWANANNGDDWVWSLMVAGMGMSLLQPAPVATDDGERERLRSSIRTAMNRIDAAKDMLDGAFDELTGGLLDGMEAKE